MSHKLNRRPRVATTNVRWGRCGAGFPACRFVRLSSRKKLGTRNWKVPGTRRLESLRYTFGLRHNPDLAGQPVQSVQSSIHEKGLAILGRG